MTYKCDKCDATFSKKYNVTRHIDTQHPDPDQELETIHCAHCDTTFKRKDNLIVHLKRLHRGETDSSSDEPAVKKTFVQKNCKICNVFIDNDKLLLHIKSYDHLDRLKQGTANPDIDVIKTAFNSRIATYRIITEKDKDDIKNYLETTKTYMLRIIDDNVQLHNAIKFSLQLHVKYMKEKKPSVDSKIFHTKTTIYDYGQDFTELFYDRLIKPLVNQSEEFQEYDSGYTFVEVASLEININKYDPFYGSSYISLPAWIKQKHAIINVANHDKACFAWSVISALYPVDRRKHPDRVKSYPHFSKMLQLDNISFPMKITDIPKFESLNPQISINVFGLEEEKIIGPVYHTRKRKENHINLLYIQNETGDGHYCWIKDMSRLVGSQINHKKCRKYICDGCLMSFYTNEKLQSHQQHECGRTVAVLPEDERYLKFRTFQRTINVPFVIYANFASILKPATAIDANSVDSAGRSLSNEPYGFSYYVRCSFNSHFNKLRSYHGPDCVCTFWSQLQKDLEWIYVCYRSHEIPEYTAEHLNRLHEADKCPVCDKPYAILKDKNAQDSRPNNSLCQDPTHPRSNSPHRFKFFVPVVLHHLTDDRANSIIREIGYDKEQIEPVAYSNEKRISFTKRVKVDKNTIKIRFMDSYRFLSSDLDNLVRNLNPQKFQMLANEFLNNDEKDLDLIKLPAIFPRIDNETTLRTSLLPSKEVFIDNRTGIEIDDQEYRRVQATWSQFECETLADYANLCLKMEVLHLADVFETFRTTCTSTYGLDPAQYLTLEDLSWQAMLKTTDITLELLTDFEMLQFFKQGIRAGLSQCSKRKATANNKYMPDYDPNADSSYLVYFTANNLYDWAMSQPLPTGRFRWLSQTEMNSFDVDKIADDGRKGYVLEVDLEYPDFIHDRHADFPFCPEKQSIFETAKDSGTSKLIASVCNKSNYVIHYRNLSQCLANGLVLTKIHRILEFDQSKWLKSFVDKNNNLCNESTNPSDRVFFNSMNNAILGKSLENIENLIDVKLISHWENIKNKRGAQYFINSPNYRGSSIFNENLVAIHSEKLRVKYDKPIYLGFCILDLSKLRMYDFHYRFMKPKYNYNVELLYTCTNFFIYQVRTDDFYQDIKSNIDFFDTSDYPACNRYDMPLVNDKLMGKFKDIFDGKLLLEFVGTKSKCYSYVVEDEKPLKQENDLNVSNFRSYLQSISSILHHIHNVRFNVYTQLVNRLTLYCTDDKRFVIPNSEKTLPWGHNKIKEYCL